MVDVRTMQRKLGRLESVVAALGSTTLHCTLRIPYLNMPLQGYKTAQSRASAAARADYPSSHLSSLQRLASLLPPAGQRRAGDHHVRTKGKPHRGETVRWWGVRAVFLRVGSLPVLLVFGATLSLLLLPLLLIITP